MFRAAICHKRDAWAKETGEIYWNVTPNVFSVYFFQIFDACASFAFLHLPVCLLPNINARNGPSTSFSGGRGQLNRPGTQIQARTPATHVHSRPLPHRPFCIFVGFCSCRESTDPLGSTRSVFYRHPVECPPRINPWGHSTGCR